MNTKFELSDVTEVVNGKTLYRIKALCDFSNVKKGDCSSIRTFSRIKEHMVNKDINTSKSSIMKFCSTLPDNFLNQELSNNDLDSMISMYVANLSEKKG